MGPSRQIDLDGRPESSPSFQKAPYQFLDKEGYGWVVEGGDVLRVMLQAASVKAAKSTVISCKGTVAINEADYHKRNLQTALANTSVTTSILLELLANRKTVLGVHPADHNKMGMMGEDLAQTHAVLDAKRMTLVNRTVVRWRCGVHQRLREASHYRNLESRRDTITFFWHLNATRF
jgi:hypothetical protein